MAHPSITIDFVDRSERQRGDKALKADHRRFRRNGSLPHRNFLWCPSSFGAIQLPQ
jgi:hypothetical protein